MVSLDDFEAMRPRLRGLAYRMLGSLADAEDVVQETWLRCQRAATAAAPPRALEPPGQAIGRADSPAAFLTTVATRLCLDQLRQASRDVVAAARYQGVPLAEPVVHDGVHGGAACDPAELLGSAQHLSLGFLLVLHRLAPLERAAFVLHDVLGLGFADVAPAIERSEAACRQLASRARRRLAQARVLAANQDSPAPVLTEHHRALWQAFAAALGSGDAQALAALLAEDVRLVSDGGSRCAVGRPLLGAGLVARTLLGFVARAQGLPLLARPVTVNGQPGALVLDPVGRVDQLLAFECGPDGRFTALYFQRNPAKLMRVAQALGR